MEFKKKKLPFFAQPSTITMRQHSSAFFSTPPPDQWISFSYFLKLNFRVGIVHGDGTNKFQK